MSKIEPQGYIYVSKKHKVARIKEDILREIKAHAIPYIANAKTVLLFNPNASPEEILASLKIIEEDIKLRIVGGDKQCLNPT